MTRVQVRVQKPEVKGQRLASARRDSVPCQVLAGDSNGKRDGLNHQATFSTSARPQFTPPDPSHSYPRAGSCSSPQPQLSYRLLSHSHIRLIKRHIPERRGHISFPTSFLCSLRSLSSSLSSPTLTYPGPATPTSGPQTLRDKTLLCCSGDGPG